MAILTKDEFFARLQERLANDSSDEGIRFLEDMTDTYTDLENRAKGDGIDWEAKYKELDNSWKKRYTSRFFNGADGGVPNYINAESEVETYNPDQVTVEDLFEVKEEK